MNYKVKGYLRLLCTVLVCTLLALVAVFGVGKEKKGSAKGIRLGLDLAGGVSITYETVKEDPTEVEMKDTVYKLQKRADDNGQTEAAIYQEGDNRINVDIPGATNAEETLKAMGRVGEIFFILGTNNIKMNEQGNYELLKTLDEIRENGDIVLDGTDISGAEESFGQENGMTINVVDLTLNDVGKEKFAKATTEHVYEQIAIVYDGKVVNAPQVREPLTDGFAQISGKFTSEEAKNLATTIRVGALPIQLKELRSNVVGASLGQEAITTSLFAAVIGFIIVLLIMAIRYRVPGIAADLALCIYVGLMVICLNLLEITLTLPGLAGIILSIGMAVDANVIIFARIQEEIGAGKTILSAIKIGFSKALSAIVDGNVTTMIAAIMLYIFGTGPIKGFATTLALGIILSMFTALFVTKFLLNSFYSIGFDKEGFYGQVKNQKIINFTKHGIKYLLLSTLLIGAGIVAMIIGKVKSGDILSYGLDFKGGTSMTVLFPDSVTTEISPLEKAVKEAIGVEASVSLVSENNSAVFKMMELNEEQRNQLKDYWVTNYNVDETKIEITNISGTVSGEMKRDAILSVAIATVCMLIYIWFRFKNLAFASSAVLALLHDVLVVLMVYAVARISVGNTFIACMLTIVGYSINATIVIFDRIRENLKEQTKKETYEDIVNKSISQTLSRNIFTSLTTFAMVASLVIFGVASIREFAVPLMAGIICGAYSSVCITGLLWLKLRKVLPEGDKE